MRRRLVRAALAIVLATAFACRPRPIDEVVVGGDAGADRPVEGDGAGGGGAGRR